MAGEQNGKIRLGVAVDIAADQRVGAGKGKVQLAGVMSITCVTDTGVPFGPMTLATSDAVNVSGSTVPLKVT